MAVAEGGRLAYVESLEIPIKGWPMLGQALRQNVHFIRWKVPGRTKVSQVL